MYVVLSISLRVKKKTLGGKDQNERSLFSVLTQVRGSLVECCVAGE